MIRTKIYTLLSKPKTCLTTFVYDQIGFFLIYGIKGISQKEGN